MILAIDFDGTLCIDINNPEKVGEPKPEVISWVKTQKQLGHKLILWTCREGMVLLDAVKFCASHGLQFDAINENIPEARYNYLGQHKVIADLYLDDKAGNIKDIIKLVDAKDFVKG